MPLGEIATAVLALAGLAIAAASITAAVSARGTKHELQNGVSDSLGRIERRQLTQERRAERMERKIDRNTGRVADLAELVNQVRRENRS